MNLLDLLRKEEDVEIKWQKILNELYEPTNKARSSGSGYFCNVNQ